MEQLKHECGVAMIRLLKPLDYYAHKYGSWAYGFNKLYLMMEKQHNRGQEGAGIASVSLTGEPGTEYMFREKAEGKDAITEIFSRVTKEMAGELLMGHLRYSTTGKSGLQYVHPFLRRNNWRAKNLCLCGNFNMTNIDEVFQLLTAQGQSPRIYGDSYLTLEFMGHRLDREVERLFVEAKKMGLEGIDITRHIDDHVEMANVLRTTMSHYDGGYVMCGLTGSGEMFSVRDPWGIRPAFYCRNDELVAVASERSVLQTTFNLQCEDIHELKPGEALIVRRNGVCRLEQILPAKKLSACSFERIYFSRGSDRDIYQERKRLREGGLERHQDAHLHRRQLRTQRPGRARLRHQLRLAETLRGQSRHHRRQHRSWHHAPREYLQDPRPPPPQENSDGEQFAPDTLSRLLWHRYAPSRGVLRFPRHNGID